MTKEGVKFRRAGIVEKSIGLTSRLKCWDSNSVQPRRLLGDCTGTAGNGAGLLPDVYDVL